MTLITEFRPVSHEFFPDSFSGAAYIGTSTADALWFYRYDSTFIEVRDVFSCQDRVFASLSTVEIKQRFRDVFKGGEVIYYSLQPPCPVCGTHVFFGRVQTESIISLSPNTFQ